MHCNPKAKARLLLALWGTLGCVAWGYVLPQLAKNPTFKTRTQQLQQQGIDPGAMFYSEHPLAFGEHRRDISRDIRPEIQAPASPPGY